MHPLINAIEEDNLDKFKKIYNSTEDINILDIKDDDGWNILSLATHYEMKEFVSFLLDNLSIENINSEKPYHPLIIALENNSPLVDTFINHPKIVPILNEIKDRSKENLILLCQRFNKKDLIEFLLQQNCNPFEESVNGRSPLSYCIETNDIELFNLYSTHVDFNKNYKFEWLEKCILHNSPDIFEKILNVADIESEEIDQLFTNALNFKNVQIISSLLDTGEIIPGRIEIAKMIEIMCYVYQEEKQKESALNIANFLFDSNVPFSHFVNRDNESVWNLVIENDNDIIFERLIKSKETVEVTDDKKNTPLIYAIKKKNLGFVSELLKNGANVSQKDKFNNTPLIHAVMTGNNEIVKEILKYPNTLINDKNINEDSALSIAIKNKRMDIVSSLIWKGAEITKNPVKFIEQNDIYHIGISGNYEKAFEDIQEKEINNFVALNKLGFNLNQKNENGDTFLLHFIKEGYLANFKAMLRCSFNPNYVDQDGNTALMCAMKKTQDDYFMGLLWHSHNIDFSITNNNNENIYDLAKEYQNEKRCSALIRYDRELNYENLSKILPIVTMSSSLEEHSEYILDFKDKLLNYQDDYKNNLLMLSVLGSNIDNFKWLLSQSSLNFNLLHVNKNGENISSLIDKLPEKEALLFNQTLSLYLKKNKLKPS